MEYKNIEKKSEFQQIALDLPPNLTLQSALNALKTLTKHEEIRAEINSLRAQSLKIGFVPTMGALHEGHLSLINAAKNDCDRVICSVFVNPTQFNSATDFDRYPRNFDQDAEILKKSGCDILFLPSAEEIYPNESYKIDIDFDGLDQVLEGAHRPGHFKGVGMVVKRLFELVPADNAYFGLKDYQQFLIIKKLVQKFNLPIQIIGLPTVRESSGLAMSSRNQLLTENEKQKAVLLSTTLYETKAKFKTSSIEELVKNATTKIESDPDFNLDYFEIVDAETLKKIDSNKESKAIALVAASIGKVRLIDNMTLSE